MGLGVSCVARALLAVGLSLSGVLQGCHDLFDLLRVITLEATALHQSKEVVDLLDLHFYGDHIVILLIGLDVVFDGVDENLAGVEESVDFIAADIHCADKADGDAGIVDLHLRLVDDGCLGRALSKYCCAGDDDRCQSDDPRGKLHVERWQ